MPKFNISLMKQRYLIVTNEGYNRDNSLLHFAPDDDYND